MNPWVYIIIGGILVISGGIMAGYGWHIMPKSATSETDLNQINTHQVSSIPLVDLELVRVKAPPEFVQFEVQFAYDIILHNKSNVPISHVEITRIIIPNENKGKIFIHEQPQSKLKPFQRHVNVLGAGERKKIYREGSSSYEYTKFTITYKDEYAKRYQCNYEGDRDGVILKSNRAIGDIENKR